MGATAVSILIRDRDGDHLFVKVNDKLSILSYIVTCLFVYIDRHITYQKYTCVSNENPHMLSIRSFICGLTL